MLNAMLEAGYRPYSEMPAEYKDGRLVLLGSPEVGYDFPMRWNPRRHNMLVQRRKMGIWEMEGCRSTWSDENTEGAPEFWRLPNVTDDLNEVAGQGFSPSSAKRNTQPRTDR